MFGRFRCILGSLFVLSVLVASCSPRVQDDGYAFLARYKAEWQRGTPNQAMAPPAPSTTRTDPSTGAAAPRQPSRTVVFLDPGHGGVDTGTIGTINDGTQIFEKTYTLKIALRTAAYLRHNGIDVVLSRTDDSLPGAMPDDYTGGGKALTPDGVLADLQRRIDRANASGARVFLSMHLNGFDDPSVGGSETFYDASRPFASDSRRFAALVQNTLIADLRANGYDTPDRGVTDDQDLETESLGALAEDYHHLVLLGPAVPGRLRPSQMSGALSEPLFLSNPSEANAVVGEDFQDIIASAYAKAIEQFLRTSGPSHG